MNTGASIPSSGPTVAWIEPASAKAAFFREVAAGFPAEWRSLFLTEHAKLESRLRRAGLAVHRLADLPPEGRAPSPQEVDEALGPLLRATASDPSAVRRRASTWIRRIDPWLERQRVVAGIVWGGSSLLPSVTAARIRQRGGTVLVLQNGYFPGTVQVDPEGCNASARAVRALPEVLASWRANPAKEAELARVLAAFREAGPRPRPKPPPALPPPSLGARAAHLRTHLPVQIHRLRTVLRFPNRHIRRARHPLPDSFVLLPLQVREDTQLHLHSPVWGNRLEELVPALGRALAEVDPSLPLVVKLHPKDESSDYDRLAAAHPEVVFVDRIPMPECLRKARAVVTVNSTAGFEALCHDLPVLMLGENFYGLPGVVEKAVSRADLGPALERTLTGHPDRERRRKLLLWTYHRFLVHGHYRDGGAESVQSVRDALLGYLRDTKVDPGPS